MRKEERYLRNMFLRLLCELRERDPDAALHILERFGFEPLAVTYRRTKKGVMLATVHRWPWER